MTVKFPGMPIALSSYTGRAEAIAFPPTSVSGGNLEETSTTAPDQQELSNHGIYDFTPISPSESFKLTGITAGSTAILRYALSGETLAGNKRVPLHAIILKKIQASGNRDFTYKATADIQNPQDLADGEWCLVDAENNTVFDSFEVNLLQNKHYYAYFVVRDGGAFDLDGLENGEIDDPTILGIVETTSPPQNPGDNDSQPGTSPGTSQPSNDTQPKGFSITLSGTIYPATIQPDGSLLIILPFGTDITNLAPTFTLPTGAKSDPASGAAQGFTNPVTYTITAADGKTTVTYVVVVKVGADPNLSVEKELLSPDPKGWTAEIVVNRDKTASVKIKAPITSTKQPAQLDLVQNILSGVTVSAVNQDGETLVTYKASEGTNLYLLIEGSAASRNALERLVVSRINYWIDGDETSYYQIFNGTSGFKLADMKITSEVDNSAAEEEQSGGSGCNGGYGLLLCLAGSVGLKSIRRQKSG